jgi:Tol biopolymer transport system component
MPKISSQEIVMPSLTSTLWALCFVLVLSIFSLTAMDAHAAKGDTTRVSVSSSGVQANGDTLALSISSDGMRVAFSSTASNLVTGDGNMRTDIFVHDRETSNTELASVSLGGGPGNGDSESPSISPDGQYVAFASAATNLVSGDANLRSDIFLFDRVNGDMVRVSVKSNGEEVNGDSASPAVSTDGWEIAYSSIASDLVVSDTNARRDIFVRERRTGTTRRVSVSSSGAQGDRDSQTPAISSNGRYVAFASSATNLVLGDTNGRSDIFVHDRQTRETTRVSISSSRGQGNGDSSAPSISSDGRYVAFLSAANNLVAGDTNARTDAFVHDRQTSETRRVSVSTAGVQGDGDATAVSISPDGRYVAFASSATTLVASDDNGYGDVFVHDMRRGRTTRVSVSSSGVQATGESRTPAISNDASAVAFVSSAPNLVIGDTNGRSDAFVHEYAEDTSTVTVSAGCVADPSAGFGLEWMMLLGLLATLRLRKIAGYRRR